MRMVVFAAFFMLGVWLLQQQAALPDFVWAWLLPVFLFTLALPLLNNRRVGTFWVPTRSAKVYPAWAKKPAHPTVLIVRTIRALLLATFACGLGFYHAAWQAEQRLAVSLPDTWQGRDIAVVGVVAELPRAHEKGWRFVFEVERTHTLQAGVPRRIYLSTYTNEKDPPLMPKAGERWQFTVRLKQPHGSANPHGFDFEAWALERDIRALGYVHGKGDNRRVDELAGGFGYRIERWRETVRERFATTLADAPHAGVLTALAIGDQNSIAPAQWQVFTRTGVNHLMSISGLHITMLAGLAFAAAYWLWRRSARLTLRLPARKAAALIALLVAVGYALLAGFAVPAQRTVYMLGAVTTALWLNRNFSPGQLLAIALLGVLLPDPWAVISPGFWLSFGAVALILFVSAHRLRPHEGDSRLRRTLAEYGHMQWAMTVGLTPLLLGLFQQASLVSPVANAVAIPLVSLVVVPLTLLGAALPFDAPLWLAHTMMGWTMALLEWLNTLPQAVWMQHAPPAWSVIAALLGALWMLMPRGFPSRWLGALLMLPLFFNAPEPPAQGTLRLIVFDVGQGLAVAAQTRNHALLYDAGPDYSGDADSGNRVLIPSLRGLGIGSLDGMVISHDDSDHSGGAASVLQAMPVGWLASSLPDGHPLLQNHTPLPSIPSPQSSPASGRGSERDKPHSIPAGEGTGERESRRCMDGQTWEWDGVRFEILHPDASGYVNQHSHDNALSCVLRISTGGHSILLTGDIENRSETRLLEQHADQLSADLLVAPHHGSKSSSTFEFVAAALPDQVVFTSGYRNRFGHPHETVLQRYADSGAELLRSDEDGAVLVEMDARGLRIEHYRKSARRYWTHQPG